MSRRKRNCFLLLSFCFSLSVFSQVSVTATTGTTGPTSYSTLKAAFDAINAGTHNGAITVSITGNTTETAKASLNDSATGSSSYSSVLIKPATGVTATISGNLTSTLVSILGSNVTIDGSNNGSNSRNLTITNTGTTNPNVVVLGSTATKLLRNVVLKNSILINGSVNSNAVIISDGTSVGTAGYLDHITIQNNSIQKAAVGIYVITSTTANGVGLNIISNDLNSTGLNAIRSTGIYVEGASGVTIQGNKIGNFNSTDNENDRGIWLATGNTNCVVEKNMISNIGYTGNGGFGAQGIYVAQSPGSFDPLIVNNMISAITGDGNNYTGSLPLNNPIGIAIDASPGSATANIYFNTIYLTGNTLNQTNAMSMGVYIANGSSARFRNNIIVNNLGLVSTTGYGAVGIYSVSGVLGSPGLLDYDDYFVNPSGAGNHFIGQMGANAYTNLSAWQTATSNESHGQTILPVFVSATDLHLIPASNAALGNLGTASTPSATITVDIDGENRSATSPDMGADEFGCTANTWTGLTSTDWNTASNWCSGIPTSATDATIPSGTPFSPIVTSGVDVAKLTVNSGASLTINSTGQVNVYGDYLNNGTFSASSGTIAFRGSTFTSVSGLSAANVIVNKTAGITLTGNVTAITSIAFTNGSVTLGSNNLTIPGLPGAITAGGTGLVITNGSGSVILKYLVPNFNNVSIPIAPNSSGLNTITFQFVNGMTTDYTLRVATGITPGIADPSKAVNRTWYIQPTTLPSSNVQIQLSYTNADLGIACNPAGPMEVAVHNGTVWQIVSPVGGIMPAGNSVTFQTSNFGPTIIANVGGINVVTALPDMNIDITGISLKPNFVENNSILQVVSRRSMKINFSIADISGRIVSRFDKTIMAGTNDLPLKLNQLQAGLYFIYGNSGKGITPVLKFIKQ